MKRILIPTDFSPRSRENILGVLESHKDTRDVTEIILLNTYIVQQTDPSLVILFNDEMKLQSKSKLESLRLEVLDMNSNPYISLTTASQMGGLKNVIVQFLQRERLAHIAITEEQFRDLVSIKEILKSKFCSLLIHKT
jgi:hypothetical protein